MCLEDVLHDRKAKAGAAYCAGAVLVHAVEAFEDAVDGVGGNSYASVFYGDAHTVVERRPVYGDSSPIAVVLDGIVNQVCHHLNQTLFVSKHRQGCAGRYIQDYGHVALGSSNLHRVHKIVQEIRHVEVSKGHAQFATLDARDVDEITQECVQAKGILIGLFEKLSADRWIVQRTVNQCFEVSLHGEDRCAKLMRYVADKLAADALEAFHFGDVSGSLFGQRIDGRGNIGNL